MRLRRGFLILDDAAFASNHGKGRSRRDRKYHDQNKSQHERNAFAGTANAAKTNRRCGVCHGSQLSRFMKKTAVCSRDVSGELLPNRVRSLAPSRSSRIPRIWVSVGMPVSTVSRSRR